MRAQAAPARGRGAGGGRSTVRARAPALGPGARLGGRSRRARSWLRHARPAPHRRGGASRQSRVSRGAGEARPALRAGPDARGDPRGLLRPVARRAPRAGRGGPGAGSRMTFTLGRKIAVGFIAALIVLVLISGVAFKSLKDLTQNGQRVEQTYQTLQVLEKILSLVGDVETGERGFLITGADHYLEPYRAARESLRAELARARGLTDDNPVQRQSLDLLQPLIARKLALVAQSISEREGGADAQTLLEESQSTMDEIRTTISRIKAEELRLLAERADTAAASRLKALWVVGVGSFAAIVLMGLAGLLIRLDLGRRRTAEAELKAAEERYRLLFDRSQAGIFRTNREGVLLECNAAFAHTLGYRAPEDARGRNAADLHTDREAMAGLLRRLLAGETVSDVEVPLKRRSGETVWVLMSVVYMPDPADPHFEGTIIDITDRKQASDRLVQLLQTEQQLKEMGDLLDACLTLSEEYGVVRRSMEGMFPEGAGALHVINASRNLAETVSAWGPGGAGGETVFAPADCWALRRG